MPPAFDRRPLAALMLLTVVAAEAASAAHDDAQTAARPAARPVAGAPATRAELVMGTIARVTLPEPRDEAFEAAFAALRRVDDAMSLYRPESGLVRLNLHAARHAEPVGDELFECLTRAHELSDLTDGAFDATILPLLRSWGAYRELAYLPAGRVDAVGWGGLVLDPDARTVRFARDGMAVDLGGIAKGYALDLARVALLGAGARRGVVDLGGNLVLLGDGPEGGWHVAVRDPARPEASAGTLVLERDRAVSSSGNYARDFAAEGWRTRSHVFDPRTGRPVPAGVAVTVWAADATTADALSTALLVLGPERAADVLRRIPGAGALFVDDAGPDRRLILAGVPPRRFEPRPDTAAPAVRTVHTESSQ